MTGTAMRYISVAVQTGQYKKATEASKRFTGILRLWQKQKVNGGTVKAKKVNK